MGLLDFAGTDDGMQALGLLGAAAPSMAPMNFAGRLAQAAQGYGGLKDASIKRQEMMQEMAMKQLQVQQATQKWAMLQPLMQSLTGGLSGAAPTVSGGDPPAAQPDGPRSPSMMRLPGVPNLTPEQGAQPGVQPGRFPLNFNQVTALKVLGGPDLLKEFEIGQTGYEQKAGSYYRGVDGSLRYMDSPKDGVSYDPNTKTVTPLTGAAEAIARQKGMETEATKRAEVRYTPLSPKDFIGSDGTPIGGNVESYLSGGTPAAPSSAPAGMASLAKIPANVQAGHDGDAYRLIKQEYDSERDPASKAALGRELMRLSASKGGVKLQSATEAAQQAAKVVQDTKPQLEYSTNAAQSFQKMGDNINGRLSESQALLQRITESRDALSRFRAGGGSETRANLAHAAQGFGVPTAIVDKIAGGDLAAVQEFQKFAAQEALQTMQQSLATDNGPAAKGNRISMELFIKNNPNIGTDPRAIEKIFNFQTKLHDDALKQSDAFVTYAKDETKPKDATMFGNFWAHDNLDSGRVQATMQTGQAKGVLPPSPAKPQNLPMKGQVVQGFKFKGGNPADKANWEQQ